MHTLTVRESGEFCITLGVTLDNQDMPVWPVSGLHRLRCDHPKSISQLAWFCRLIESTLEPRDACLLWITRWGAWPSSENWQLYYRLRESYSDFRLLSEAPGHLFLQYEKHDLVSFLEIGIISGWKMHLIPTVGYGRAYVHEEWVDFAMEDSSQLEPIRDALSKAGLKATYE